MTHSKPSAYDGVGRRKYLNTNENQRFLDGLSGLPERKRVFCLFIYYTGCRISEALNLTPKDLDRASSLAVIRCLKKRGKIVYRRVPIPGWLIQMIDDICLRGNKPIWKFSRTTGWRIIKGIMHETGISGAQAAPKGLRHAFGVRGVMNDVPLNVIRKWMGHSDLATTSIYLDVKDEEEREFISRTW